MQQTIDVTGLPDPVVQDLRKLVTTLRGNLECPDNAVKARPITPMEEAVAPAPDRDIEKVIDHDFVAFCEAGADDTVTLELVRQALAKIPGSLADDIRTERDKR